MSSENLRDVMRNQYAHRQAWRKVAEERIDTLATVSCKNYFLAFRGRNHRVCLMEDSHIVASGITQINVILALLERRYNITWPNVK